MTLDEVARRVGAVPVSGGCRFRVWAPRAARVSVVLTGSPERIVPLAAGSDGLHEGVVAGVGAGADYLYDLDGERRPDPASRYQPHGVHGPSRVTSPAFAWADTEWTGVELRDLVLYELHVGTFSPEGTFDGVIPHLDRLADLGVTAIELMPVCAFPGDRNWGYDGVFPWAVQHSYGGPDGLRRLVNEAHRRKLAVVLDVVWNHLGPEGNVLPRFGPYFSRRKRTPWGPAPAFDGRAARWVRGFFAGAALRWIDEYHLDGLRLDAVEWIRDRSAERIEAEVARLVAERAAERGRPVHLLAESDLSRPDLLRPRANGGCGLPAQWCDDLCFALNAVLVRGRPARLRGLAAALQRGFAKDVPAYGDAPAGSFVVYAQNHDQVANERGARPVAERGAWNEARLAAAVVLHAPDLPLLFMGEEWGDPAPFPFFTSFADPDLGRKVRAGRRRALKRLGVDADVPDPEADATFAAARPDPGLAARAASRRLTAWYRELLGLRRGVPALTRPDRSSLRAQTVPTEHLILFRRGDDAFAIYHFGDTESELEVSFPAGRWEKVADSAEERWSGEPGRDGPASVRGGGAVALRLPPRVYLLFVRSATA